MGEEKGIEIEAYFSKQGVFESVDWVRKDITINDETGKPLFVQKDVEFPSTWSERAKQIVASRYFYGQLGTSERENSIKDIIGRVTETFTDWAIKKKYFANEEMAKLFGNELASLTLNQKMAFNSPVWFNVGVYKYLKEERKTNYKEAYIIDDSGNVIPLPFGEEYKYPQTSACFIQSVEDTMESIMHLAVNEAMLFKYGSGTGTDLTTLRSSRERLSGGGRPSGPLQYLQFYDKVAGIVKSGGKTRRAAKMNSLDTEHPDILEFIQAKTKEQRKFEVLMDYGGCDFKEAESTVSYQNANLSIRAKDKFMHAVENDEEWQTIPVHNKEMANEMPKYKARMLLKKLAEGTWLCGDPGMQFYNTINKWHTCPESAPINASNPCSEFLFLNNSSCNLASLNLMKYIDNDVFNIDKFSRAVKLTAIAQDLEFDNSSFPTKEIAENSHKFRPLGMGYANLGSLLMYLGLPYDSEEGRAVAAVITALMTGKAYEASTEMAEKISIFEEYEKNKNSMMKIIKMHRDALSGINTGKLPKGFINIFEEAKKTWDIVVERGEKWGFRNAQATVLAPTGTIGFMMDCDTTGIEPEAWLVKHKKLAEGGSIKIINNTVKTALIRLGYSEDEIGAILRHIDERDTIEGSILKEEHLSVFDCSYKPTNGKRSIHYLGHLKMMAAVQPFLSGAISKTVGLPNEITVDEIEKIYIDAWKMGLKAVALYRDGSKRWQPLSTKKKDEITQKPMRRKLPVTAKSVRHKFSVSGHEGYIHVGMYDDGTLGEVFISMSKEGSTIGGLMDAFATSISLNLQYGVTLESLVKKFRHQNFEPRGLVFEGHKDIKTATSIIDYVFNYLAKSFLIGKPEAENGDSLVREAVQTNLEIVRRQENNQDNEDNEGEMPGGFCITCGSQMIKKGNCIERCPKCGWVNPKGCGE